MSEQSPYTLVDDIKCYHLEEAQNYINYPDSGFDLTEKNAEQSFWVSSRNRLFKKLVFDQLNSQKKTTFLEIGCGTGHFIQHLTTHPALQITGSEIYLRGLNYAKKKMPNVDFIQFDVAKSAINEKFDMIAAFDVLEHIEQDRLALQNIHTMLNTEGVFIVSVPQHMFLWSNLDDMVKHKRRYSRRELKEKLQTAGFEISYATSFVFMLFPLMLLSRLWNQKKNSAESEPALLEKQVTFSGLANKIFSFFMRIDERLIAKGCSLPFGGTLVMIAKKTKSASSLDHTSLP